MPRKRRFPKQRPTLPTGLAAISLCERALWASRGPLLDEDDAEALLPLAADLYTVWPDWSAWASFYENIRPELFASRPYLAERSVAEACFVALVGVACG